MAECRDWKAWHDTMPGKDPTLHVSGTCQFPTTGFTVELVPEDNQGPGLSDYRLRLVVHEPTGPVNEVITDVPADYTEVTDIEYDTVSITPDGPTGIKVDPVS